VETSLFIIEGLTTADDDRYKVLDVSTWTPKGRVVRLEIRVDLKPAMVLTQDGVSWSLSGVVFRSLGKPSDGMVSNLEQLSHRKGGKGSRAKMKSELHFAMRALEGDPSKIGAEKVDLALRFKAQPSFDCRLVINKSTDVFLVIDDASDAAAIAAFSA
jgi:hypothetical protein